MMGIFQPAILVYKSVNDSTIDVWEVTYPYPQGEMEGHFSSVYPSKASTVYPPWNW